MKQGASTRSRADEVTAAWWAGRSLTLFRAVLGAGPGRALMDLLEALARAQGEEAFDAYHRFEAEVLARGRHIDAPGSVSLWQGLLMDAVLSDVNPFTVQAERFGRDGLTAAVRTAAADDLAALQRLFELSGRNIREAVAECVTETSARRALEAIGWEPGYDGPAWPSNDTESGNQDVAMVGRESDLMSVDGALTREMKRMLASGRPWAELVDQLADYYAAVGVGDMARFKAFRWRRDGARGVLEGVRRPDPIRLSDLIGYQSVREPIIRNTIQFIEGRAANNVLLYGDRGTGKSATVKAILNEYAPRGLRLVEVPRPHLADVGEILAILKERPQRFILFVDDLSFDEQETEYKYLKALLEGSVESRPDNVLVYATSNRRHLVRERFSDRNDGPSDELRREDTLQEKLSLADRFGLTVVFPSPDQQGYLQIVEGLAAKEGLTVDPDTLRAAALRWVLWNNDRSARTARQFIDDLKGRLELDGNSGA